MRIGLDYRPATVAPASGIGRQVLAQEQALLALPDTELVRFTEAPLDHPQRATARCPDWASPLQGLQRPQVRWRFEAGFLPRALREARIDLYIATANMGLPLGRKRGRKQVLVLHDLFQLTERNFHRSRLKALAYRCIDGLSIAWSVLMADRIWCPSQFSADEAARLFPFARNKLRVLPNLVPGFAATPAQVPEDLPERFWLAVGTREPRKNMALFLACWQQARQQSAQVPALVLVGHAEDVVPELRELPGLYWRSGLSEAQLCGLYRSAECLWQPSYGEGFGLPVVEALSVSTPVAAATGSALDEVLPPGSPRFAAHDRQALLDCLLQVAAQPPARSPQLAEWARRYEFPAYSRRLNELVMELSR